MQAGSRTAQRGFTYLAALAATAMVTLGLSGVAARWSDADLRWREQELLRLGQVYARAIARYRDSSPGSARQLPRSLEQLLLDDRFIGGRRHLRALYPDPMQPQRRWGLVRDSQGGIQGVYSLDERRPFLSTAARLDEVDLPAAQRYSDWKFVAREAP